ncbi:fibronectin type III domain-containing protein [Eggerthella lenta]|nr:fibronectin type III domain-containing protein [Eggerthella lenta]MDB1800256.1 fibronectin type III domain-containing protein [Eggerthella lenta]
MKRTHRALSAALAVVLASSLCTIPAYAVESDAEPAPPGRVQADETAPNQSPEADHGPGNEVPDASGTAEASGSKSQTRTENATEPTASPLQAENASRSAVAPPAGELRVTLTEGRPAATAGTAYEVALADSDGVQVGAQQLNLSLEGDSWSVARFDGLADGSYTLSVRAPGIAPYSQKIDVKGDSSAVELYVGDLAADPQAPARIGVLVPGDVNGDGTVDDADASAIIDDIEAGAASPACDANGDGTVSLADLETAVSSFDRVAVEATVARSLPPAAVEAAPGEGTEVASGSLDEVVGADAKPVSLRASEAISDEHPVEVSFDLAKDSEQAPQLGGMVINVPASGDHAPEAGRLLVELTDGTVREIGISRAEARAAFFRSSAPTAVIDENGTVVVDFGGQIAVKKVTLVITKTQGNTNLAEVSKVELLNNMEERIPEPELSIPGELSAVAGSKQFSVSWKPETNVTGYELSISANGREEVKRTTGTSLSVTQFDEQKIKNGTVFTLKVRSTNGAWRSDWPGSVQVTPKAEKVPDAPEGISLSGAYRGFKASWKNMEDTDSYNLFYREKGDEGGDFTKVPDLTKTSCSVDGLKDDTEYQVYLTGANEIGESAPSVMAVVRTANVKPAQLPAYRLVNTENADGDYLNRIVSATYGRGSMIDSPLDETSGEAKSAYGLFDDDYASYLKVADWDEGGFYPALGKGVTVTFDQPQTLGMVSFADVQDGVPYGRVSVSYVDDAGAWQTVQANVQMRTGENGRKYVLAKLPQPVTSSKVRIGMGHSWSSGNVVVAEMRFHAYDSLENDIMALYADDLHLELKDDVTSAAVDEL